MTRDMATNMEYNVLYERILRDEDPRDTVPIPTLTKRKAIDIYSLFRRAQEEVTLVSLDTRVFATAMHHRRAAILNRLETIISIPEQTRLTRSCILTLTAALDSLNAMQEKLARLNSLSLTGQELSERDAEVDDTEHPENHPIDLQPTAEDIDAMLSQIAEFEALD